MTVWNTVVPFVLAAALYGILAYRTKWSRRQCVLATLSVLVLTFAVLRLRSSGTKPPPDPGRETVQQPNSLRLVRSDAASASCRNCHPEHYDSWHRTFHRTMTQVAGPDTVVAPFDGVVLQNTRLIVPLFRRGEEFWTTMVDPEWQDDWLKRGIDPASHPSPRIVDKRIVMTTGSHHMQAYWVQGSKGNQLYKFPWMYVIDDQQWVADEDAFLQPPNTGPKLSHVWNRTCIKCHAQGGRPGYDEHRDVFTSEVTELGITCASCHGPGDEHIAQHQDSRPVETAGSSDQTAPTIVLPSRLSHTESSQICGQCHGNYETPNMLKELTDGFSYHAGADYQKTHRIIRFGDSSESAGWIREQLYWGDGACRVGGDEYNGLIESACHQRGTMSCLSCHSLHSGDPDKLLTSSMRGNQACLQCHADYRDRVSEHTHHPAGSAGSLCYNCHMPRTSYALFTAMRSHRIDSPNVRSSVATGRPNACNLCHLDQTLAWSAGRLSEWYGHESVELTQEQQSRAASLLWMLRGNAMQRVLATWSMAWTPAREASGANWQAPLLELMRQDPYTAIRYVAERSLERLRDNPPADSGPPLAERSDLSRLLYRADGQLDRDAADRLRKRRDESPIMIFE
ncbi:MAG: hypothetical protein HY290_10290 [Planctomycetia bacterium]|nr:hypothetical protein [Planctomycetia bacterium]